MSKRWQNAGLVALAVLTAAAVVGAVRANNEGSSTAGVTPPSLVAPSTAPPTASSAAPPIAVLFGDSYVQGHGATSPARGFLQLLSAQRGWTAVLLAIGGTGYATAGPNPGGAPYTSRLQGVIDARPQVVIVSGGRNDVGTDPGTEEVAVATVFRTLHAQLPEARVFAVSPLWDSTPPPTELGVIGADVRSACAAYGCTYLDVGQPLEGRPDLVGPDHEHPDDAGYRRLYEAVEAKLPSG